MDIAPAKLVCTYWGLSFLSEMTGQSPENLKAQIIIWENTN